MDFSMLRAGENFYIIGTVVPRNPVLVVYLVAGFEGVKAMFADVDETVDVDTVLE